MPHIKHHINPKDRSIDYGGAVTIILGLVPFLLALVWGGNQYPWKSVQVITLFALSAIFLTAFVFFEKRAKEPILPLDLFKNNIFLISVIIIFFIGLAMFGAIIYIPLFAQAVIGVNATDSGIILTPMTFAIIVGSIISGQLISRTGKYKLLAIFGLAIATVSIFWLSTMDTDTTQKDLVLRMITTGFGLGVTFPIFTIAVQNAFEYSKLGVVTSSIQLFRSLGGTVGVAIMGSILNNQLTMKLPTLRGDAFLNEASRIDPQFNIDKLHINELQAFFSGSGRTQFQAAISSVPSQFRPQLISNFSDFLLKLKTILAESISEIFLIASFLMIIALLASFFLREIPLRKSHTDRPFAEETGISLAEEEGAVPPKQEVEIFNAK